MSNIHFVPPGKFPFPTPFQAALVTRAMEAERYTPRHKALWRRLFQHAQRAILRGGLNVHPIDIVNHWEQCTPESPSKDNTIALDDIKTGFLTIAQESGAVVFSLDNFEEYGNTYQPCWEEEILDNELHLLREQERLEALMDWEGHTGTKARPLNGLHAVTQERDLPDWLAHEVDPDPEAHLEPAFLGFEGLNQPL
tara:strand:- start:891 stop:1478 length:588 start_codon:yes stop_codon:yes gene_type:complete